MLHKVVASANGRDVSRLVRAETAEAAISGFIENWTEHGDAAPVGTRVEESWKESA